MNQEIIKKRRSGDHQYHIDDFSGRADHGAKCPHHSVPTTLHECKMLGAGQAEARKHNKTLEAGSPDPEHGRTSRGVGVIAQNVLTPIALVKPSKAYEEAAATGNIIRAPHGSVATNIKTDRMCLSAFDLVELPLAFLGVGEKDLRPRLFPPDRTPPERVYRGVIGFKIF